MKQRFYSIVIGGLLIFILWGCHSHYTPKPMEYFRIDLPQKKYILYDSVCPYSFQYPAYARIVKGLDTKEPCWISIDFPSFKATVYITYFAITNNLSHLLDDCHTLAYKHDIKADAIHEILYSDTLRKIYGMVYEIKGDAASPLQFYVTDSVKHFLRASLYFNVKPNKDSLAPVIEFIDKDVKHLIETLTWK